MSRHQPRSRYTAYDGGPDPLAPPVDIAEALDAIGEDVMAGYSPERAMREFLRRGGQDQRGLDDLARRIAEKRRELTQRHNLDGTLQEVRELLDHAVLSERGQLARDIDLDEGDRALRELTLDNLPTSTAAAVNELSSYDWKSREAREDFEQIKDLLGREMLDQRFAGMKEALDNATDADRAAINEMLTDLNDLLAKHARGEDTPEDFADFMDKHGDFFPENPQTVDELIDAMAQRAAAAQRMMNSMTAEQRAELMELAQQAFGSPELMQQLSQLDTNLQSLRPGEDWGGSEQFDGEQGLGLGDGTGVIQDLAGLDQLAEQLSQSFGVGVVRAEADPVGADEVDEAGDRVLPERVDPDVALEHLERVLGELLGHLLVGELEVASRASPTQLPPFSTLRSWTPGKRVSIPWQIAEASASWIDRPPSATAAKVLGRNATYSPVGALPGVEVVLVAAVGRVQRDEHAGLLDAGPERVELGEERRAGARAGR